MKFFKEVKNIQATWFTKSFSPTDWINYNKKTKEVSFLNWRDLAIDILIVRPIWTSLYITDHQT